MPKTAKEIWFGKCWGCFFKLFFFVFWFGKLLLSVSIRGLSLPVFLTLPESEGNGTVTLGK